MYIVYSETKFYYYILLLSYYYYIIFLIIIIIIHHVLYIFQLLNVLDTSLCHPGVASPNENNGHLFVTTSTHLVETDITRKLVIPIVAAFVKERSRDGRKIINA